MSITTVPFNNAQFQLLAMFLHDGALEFEELDCDDLSMAASADAKALFAAIAQEQRSVWADDERITAILSENIEVSVDAAWAMDYLGERCSAQLTGNEAATRLNTAEITAIGMLLDRIYLEHARQAQCGDYMLSLQVDPDGNQLVADALAGLSTMIACLEGEELAYATGIVDNAKATIHASHPADDWIEIPDYWLMHYFSKRCFEITA